MLLFICTNGVAMNTVLADNHTSVPPIPGNMNGERPIFNVGYKKPISDTHPDISEVSRDVDIVDLITQIDEPMILGYLQGLTSFGPRVTGETGCVQSAEYLYNEFAGMGLEVRYHDWEYEGYNSNNVEATLPGADPTSDDIYLVCGHYDTVPGSPGADDDGSGVVAVLAAAQMMSQYEFNHTVRFVAFSGEEEGLLGSFMYAQDAYDNGDDIKGVLNADMIAFALNDEQAGYMNIYEDDFSEWLYDYTFTINQLYNDYIGVQLIHSGWTWGSDHNSFWDFGYSALFYQEYEFSHYYHSPQDTIENLNITYEMKTTRLIVATLASLAQINSLNSPPSTPIIQGPHYGKIGVEYTFSIGPITDPDEDQMFILLEWGDGSQSSWLGPFDSGQVFTATHSWSEPGAYGIRIKAKDSYGATSAWSEQFIIYITSKVFLIGLVSDVNSSAEATHLMMKRGVMLEFQPFEMTKCSSVQTVILNDETKGYLGSRFIIGQFYALVLF
jgi:hypothetical protein